MTNGITVLDDVLTLVLVGQQHLVTCGGILQNGDVLTIDGDDFSLTDRLQTDYYAVGWIDFQKFLHSVFVLADMYSYRFVRFRFVCGDRNPHSP